MVSSRLSSARACGQADKVVQLYAISEQIIRDTFAANEYHPRTLLSPTAELAASVATASTAPVDAAWAHAQPDQNNADEAQLHDNVSQFN